MKFLWDRILAFFSRPWLGIVSLIGTIIGVYFAFFPNESVSSLNIYFDRNFTVFRNDMKGNPPFKLNGSHNINEQTLRISRFKIENYSNKDLRPSDFSKVNPLTIEVTSDHKLLGYTFFEESKNGVASQVNGFLDKDSSKFSIKPFELFADEYLIFDLWSTGAPLKHPKFIVEGSLYNSNLKFFEEGELSLFPKNIAQFWKGMKRELWFSIPFGSLILLSVALAIHSNLKKIYLKARLAKVFEEDSEKERLKIKVFEKVLLTSKKHQREILDLLLDPSLHKEQLSESRQLMLLKASIAKQEKNFSSSNSTIHAVTKILMYLEEIQAAKYQEWEEKWELSEEFSNQLLSLTKTIS